MKKVFPFLLMSALCLSSCAHYNAVSLSTMTPELIPDVPVDGIVTVAKTFSRAECKRFLDRDVISKGFQPIQLFIENGSDKTYLFSTSRVQLSLVSPEEVAEKLHTSTLGRIGGYGAAAVFATPLFIIPAVVEGFQSSKANDALDQDFAAKAAKDQLIYPYTHANMLLFVPVDNVQDTFIVTLLEENTRKPKRLTVKLKNSH